MGKDVLVIKLLHDSYESNQYIVLCVYTLNESTSATYLEVVVQLTSLGFDFPSVSIPTE